jgi:hypothetical protein
MDVALVVDPLRILNQLEGTLADGSGLTITVLAGHSCSDIFEFVG